MIAVYLAHQLTAPTREGIEENRDRAKRWAVWLWKQGFSVECSWIVCTELLEETPENRELGLRSDCEQVRRCDVMVLCGPKISGGMLREAGAAKVIVDFTCYGLELPSRDLEWRDGAPISSIKALEKIVAERTVKPERLEPEEALSDDKVGELRTIIEQY